jgi:hypothetical protein
MSDKTNHSAVKEKEEHKPEITQEKILEFIRRIDSNKSLFKRFDVFKGWALTLVSIAGLIFVADLVALSSNTSEVEKVVLSATVVSVILAFFALLGQFGKENIVRVNYGRIEACFLEDEKPFAKALIKLKAENTDFPLEQTFNMNKEMFTPKKLLERLYN